MTLKELALFLVLMAGAALLRVVDISRPFNNGLRGDCGAGYSIMAENHLRYGIGSTGLVPVMNARPVDRNHFVYYEHHPPGMVALTAGVFALLQSSEEAVARILPILLSLTTMAILFFWVRRASGSVAAFTTAALASTVPLSAYYGPFLNFETFVLPPVLFSIYMYMRWLEEGRFTFLRGSLILMAVGALMDWIALLAGILMWLDGLFFVRGGFKKEGDSSHQERKPLKIRIHLLGYPALSVFVFLAIKAWFQLQNTRFGSPSEDTGSFIHYLAKVTPLNPEFKVSLFLKNIGLYLANLSTWPVLLAAAVGLSFLLFILLNKRCLSHEIRSIVVLLAWGGLNMVLFASHATLHDYWIVLLYPGLFWCAGVGVRGISNLLNRQGKRPFLAYGAVIVLVGGLTGFGGQRTLAITKEMRGKEEQYQLGLAYGELAKKGELLITPKVSPKMVRYSKGAVYHFAIDTPKMLEQRIPEIRRYGYGELPIIFVVHQDDQERFKSSMEAFEKVAPPQRMGPFFLFPL